MYPSTHQHTKRINNKSTTHTVTYQSGTLSVGMTETHGQFVSVRWTKRCNERAKQNKLCKVNEGVENKQNNNK